MDFEKLKEEVLRIVKKGEFEVHCERTEDGGAMCERYRCGPNDFCQLVADYDDLLEDAFEVCKRFAEERGLEVKDDQCPSRSWTKSSGTGFYHAGFEDCVAVLVDGEEGKEYHVHVIGATGEVHGKRYLKVDRVEIVEEKIWKGLAKAWADEIPWEYIRLSILSLIHI